MSSFTSIFKITPGVQSYDWGKIGSTSLAAQFGERCIDGFSTDNDKPYAELWMGTHVTLPSHQTSTSTPLSEILASNPEKYLSKQIVEKYPNAADGQLPFLFKVLSIGKALSIQAHPDKKLAERLHKERPDVYKDPNHKPEMAIALTPFRGFCGFLPLPQMLLLLSTIPEMRSLIGEEPLRALASTLKLDLPEAKSQADEALVKLAQDSVKGGKVEETTPEQKKALRRVFEVLMKASEEDVKNTLRSLLSRYTSGSGSSSYATEAEASLVDLVVELNGQFPDDVGVLCCFILNVVTLEVGKSVFLKADEPHAYISGDIIECMATSDNVVRAGLTPKLRDVDTLIEMLTYVSAPADAQLLTTSSFAPKTELYDPPIEEFSVLRTSLSSSGEKETHRPIEGPSIIIVTEGSGEVGDESVERGDVVFVAAGVEVGFEAREGGFTFFRAFVEA